MLRVWRSVLYVHVYNTQKNGKIHMHPAFLSDRIFIAEAVRVFLFAE